jgi:LuxR family transcriptional regulator, maltose regulon positive regulatory protein
VRIAITTIRKPQRRPKTVRRPRLLDLIHQNVQRKLTFVCAPAGYGKTTLLVDFSEDTDARVAWCRLGPEDGNLAYFFQHLILSLREAYPKFGDALESISFQEAASSPRALAIELVNEIAASISDFTLLVLDDYHAVSEALTIVGFVEQLLELLPDQLRVIIGSRSIYGIPTASLFVNEELAALGADDLRFRVDEVKDLARRRFRLRLTDAQATEITSQSEGWITSILLAMQDWKPSIVIPKLAGAREQVYEYLAKEVYTGLPPETKGFLLSTAICDQFNIPLANSLLGITHSRRIIKELEDGNLFLSSVRNGGELNYQYHQLFRDFLVTQFQQKPSGEQARIHMLAAGWFERQGDAVQAIRHYLLAGEREQAAGIMDAFARPLYISGQEQELDEWFQILSSPPDLKHLAPDLVLNWVKVRVNQGKMEGCLHLLDLAEPIFLAQKKFDNLANCLVVRGMVLRFQGRFQEGIELAARTVRLVEEKDLDGYYAYQARRLEGLGLFHTGRQPEASAALETALQGFRDLTAARPSDRLKHDLIQVLTDIGMMSLLIGDIFHAQGSFEEALSISLTLRGNRGDLASCANNRAYLAFLMGDFRQAWQYYEQALTAAEQADWTRSIVQVLNGQAELLTICGEFERAAAALQKAAACGQSVSGGQISPATFQEMAELEKLGGNFTQAMYYLRAAAHASRVDLQDPGYLVRAASVYLSMEQWQVARENLETALQNLAADSRPSQLRSLGHYYLAETFFHLDDREKALARLQDALSEAARLGYDTFLVEAAHHSAAMLQELATQWDNKHLAGILSRASKIPTAYSQLLPAETGSEGEIPYALQVRALGDCEIRRDGEVLPLAIWQSARTRALFFFLLDQGRAKRDEVAVQFWPDFSIAKVNSNFHATLWRVRNALGKKNVIAFDGQYYSIQAQTVLFYDVREFEELVAKVQKAGLSEVERRSIFAQAVDLYTGEFLPDIDLPWSNARRLELQEKYLFLLEQFALHEFENNRPEEARRLYEKAIQIDPYQDFLHLGLMKCLVNLRIPSAAEKHYENYRQSLLDELGNEPMPELQAFVDRFKAKRSEIKSS